VAGIAAGTSGVGVNQLYYPYDLALDFNGSLYITDSWNNRIQKYTVGVTAGVTVAGQANGTSGASSSALYMPVGIALDSNRNLYFTDRSNHRLVYWANAASSGTTIAGTTGKRDKRKHNT
jgi:tripartite motif-containing protein 71